jgi:hypothetical protein
MKDMICKDTMWPKEGTGYKIQEHVLTAVVTVITGNVLRKRGLTNRL